MFWCDDGIYFEIDEFCSDDFKMDDFCLYMFGLELIWYFDGIVKFKGLGWFFGVWIVRFRMVLVCLILVILFVFCVLLLVLILNLNFLVFGLFVLECFFWLNVLASPPCASPLKI